MAKHEVKDDISVEAKLNEVKETFDHAMKKAEKYLRDDDKLGVIAEESFRKAERAKRAIQAAFDYMLLFYAVVRDHRTGKFTAHNKGDLLKIVAAMVYFVSPIDVFPDFIPAFGFIDDVFIIGLIAAATIKTLDKYKAGLN